MARLKNPLPIAAAAVLAALLLSPNAFAEDRLSVFWSASDDGSCDDTLHSVMASWAHDSELMDVDANVRSAPSSGDCRTDSFTYNVAAERRFTLPFGVPIEGLARFGASRTSISAPYAVVADGGGIAARADGRAAHPLTLPAGSVESVTATLGASWSAADWLRLSLGANLAPVDWADGSTGRTVHVGVHVDAPLPWGVAELAATAEVGNEAFGQVRAEWRVPAVADMEVSARAVYDWGLGALASDAPAERHFAGLPVRLTGPPADDAFTVMVGISWEI